MRKTYGPKRVEVTGCWRKMQNWELHDVLFTKHFSGDQSQRMSWVGHVEHMTREKHTRFWFGNLKKQGGRVCKGTTWIWIGTSNRLLHTC